MSQMAPCVKTLCSYSATSFPSAAGVSRSRRIVLDGRLPSKVRCGTSHAGVFSAWTSCGVLPKAMRLRLGKYVGQEQVVVAAERVKRLGKRDKVTGDELGSLMD